MVILCLRSLNCLRQGGDHTPYALEVLYMPRVRVFERPSQPVPSAAQHGMLQVLMCLGAGWHVLASHSSRACCKQAVGQQVRYSFWHSSSPCLINLQAETS